MQKIKKALKKLTGFGKAAQAAKKAPASKKKSQSLAPAKKAKKPAAPEKSAKKAPIKAHAKAETKPAAKPDAKKKSAQPAKTLAPPTGKATGSNCPIWPVTGKSRAPAKLRSNCCGRSGPRRRASTRDFSQPRLPVRSQAIWPKSAAIWKKESKPGGSLRPTKRSRSRRPACS